MAIDDDLNALLAAPQTFLASNALLIYGSNVGGSGIKDYVLQATADAGWRSCVGGPTREVPLFVMYEAAGFNGKGTGPKSTSFNAHYVSMREFNAGTASWENAAVSHYLLPAVGPAIMVTSKLNGCTFGIGSSAGGTRLVSHLRPPGETLEGRMRLDEGTRAGFAGGSLDVSVMSNGTENATILALRTAGAWTFHTQRFQMQASMKGFINGVFSYP